MKELSIEEKAKRYDEVIPQLKGLLDGIHEEKCGIMEEDILEIFPELKESEDERIRKEIITYLSTVEDKELIPYEPWIAWLEKQCEKGTNGNEREIPNSEQKPTDKVEPKFKVGDIITPKDGGHEPWQIMQVDILDKKYRFKEGYVIHFSQEDDYELVEQKPAWSEEDERIYQSIIDDTVQENQLNDEQTNWLKDIKHRYFPQPKQEWSERDKEEFHIAIETLAEAGQYDSAHWLQFLKERYVWKPSDEQMAALNAISVTGVISNAEQGQELVNLYNVLRRLRGE